MSIKATTRGFVSSRKSGQRANIDSLMLNPQSS